MHDEERSDECISCLKSSTEARHRFPDPISLKDYTEKELMQLGSGLIKKRALEFEGGLQDSILRILARRVLKCSGDSDSDSDSDSKSDIRNIRALVTELDFLSVRQARRYARDWIGWAQHHSPAEDTSNEAGKPQQGLITRDDIFNQSYSDIPQKSLTWKEIHEMVSLFPFPRPACNGDSSSSDNRFFA
jgi:hypothetical protein